MPVLTVCEIRELPVKDIFAGNNDRKEFDEAALGELAQSIDNYGLAQPITVRQVGARYEIVAGERRFRAVSQILGRATISAIIKDMDDEAASAVMLAENTSRADLNPIEEANAYQARIDRFDWTVDRIASVAGVTIDRVRRRLLLLKLTEDVQRLVHFGHFPLGHAEAMAGLDTNRQIIALRVYSQGKAMPLNEFKAMVGELLAQQSQEALFEVEDFWRVQVAKENAPSAGKFARVDVPRASHIPRPEIKGSDTTSTAIWRYIHQLQEQGLSNEAAAVGAIFEGLVHKNYCIVPRIA